MSGSEKAGLRAWIGSKARLCNWLLEVMLDVLSSQDGAKPRKPMAFPGALAVGADSGCSRTDVGASGRRKEECVTAEEGQVCVINITPKGRRMRMRFGLVSLAVGLAAYGVLLGSGQDRLWRLGLFFPLWMAGLGYFQATANT